jgi:uncharacterized protein
MQRGFSFGGHDFIVAGDAALYWPVHRALLVADLHLEKASAFATSGQMLPPYDSLATLEELAKLVGQFDVTKVFCLGDNFHDDDGEFRLGGGAASTLKRLTTQHDWLWITGNHDRRLAALWGGATALEISLSGILLRHEAEPEENEPEISGHFHPKYRQQLRGRMVSRRCFVQTANKLIMPAFGAFTGGMEAGDPAIMAACDVKPGEEFRALVPTGRSVACFSLRPLPRKAQCLP